MDKSTCKKCGKHSNFFLTIWERDQHDIPHPVTVCQACYNELQVMSLFGNYKKPRPKNGALINE